MLTKRDCREFFQIAKINCRACYSAHYNERASGADICYTTDSIPKLIEDAMSSLQRIINSNGKGGYDGKIARKALQKCRNCLVDNKPKAKSIVEFLQRCH